MEEDSFIFSKATSSALDTTVSPPRGYNGRGVRLTAQLQQVQKIKEWSYTPCPSIRLHGVNREGFTALHLYRTMSATQNDDVWNCLPTICEGR